MPSRSLLRTLIQCLAAAAGALVLVLSWVPDSRLGELPLFPSWFGAWLDQGGVVATMRTGIAMAVAAGLIHAARWMESPWKSGGVAGVLLLAAKHLDKPLLATEGQGYLGELDGTLRRMLYLGSGGGTAAL